MINFNYSIHFFIKSSGCSSVASKKMWTSTSASRRKDELTQRIRALSAPGSSAVVVAGASASTSATSTVQTDDSPIHLYEAAFKRWAAVKARRAIGGSADTGGAAPHPSERVIPKFHFGPPPERDDSFSRVRQWHNTSFNFLYLINKNSKIVTLALCASHVAFLSRSFSLPCHFHFHFHLLVLY